MKSFFFLFLPFFLSTWIYRKSLWPALYRNLVNLADTTDYAILQTIFLIWEHHMGENDKKSVSDEGSFLERAVSICFNKSSLKIIIFLKLREASIEENFY